MKKLIIHPEDRTTEFLRVLYAASEEAEVYTDKLNSKEVNHLFHHCPPDTRIMLLGHGNEHGLFYREDDTQSGFDGLQVGHSHTHFLKSHHNLVGIFCHADSFAKNEGLHGLFTGMYVSELSEAELYNINTTQDEIDWENKKFICRLRCLLDGGYLLSDIPELMRSLEDANTELTRFNYEHLYYL